MKILMMILHFPPAHSGGAEMQCWKQARALVARGHEVTILTEWLGWRSARLEIKEGVTIRRLGFFLPVTTAVRRLHRWLRLRRSTPTAERSDPFSADSLLAGSEKTRKRFRWMAPVEWMGHLSFILETGLAVKLGWRRAEVLHVHESHWLAGFGQWVGEQWNVPVFCKEACGEVLLWPPGVYVPWLARWKRGREKCRFIAITPHIRGELGKAGISPRQIVEIPNGVELPERVAQPEAHDLAIYAGNFSQGAVYKAFDVLLKAWSQAQREEPGMQLRLFGGGGAERWKQFAEREGCGASIEFMGTTNDLSGQFLEAGFLVLPSRVEGLSNVLLEAQAAGLPAVVSDIGGNVAVVKDGENGLVVPVDSVEALAVAMVKMYRSSGLRMRMGQAARLRMAEVFAIEKVAARLEDVYQEAVKGGSAGTRASNLAG